MSKYILLLDVAGRCAERCYSEQANIQTKLKFF